MASLCAEEPGRGWNTARRKFRLGSIHGSEKRRWPWKRPRLLRVEALENRIFLSVSAAVAAEDTLLTRSSAVLPSLGGNGGGQTAIAAAVAAMPAAGTTSTNQGSGNRGPSSSTGAMASVVAIGRVDDAADAGAAVGGTTIGGAAPRPNLVPFKPSGWSDRIVVSNATGTHSGNPLAPDDVLYVDWAVLNNGSRAASATFYVKLFVDGNLRNTWYVEPPLDPNYYVYVEDFSIGQLGVGQHKIQIKVDTTNAIAESNEGDNAYTKTITVSRPNLTPFAPKGWADKIVVSSATGTHTANKLYSNSTLYVDWAAINNGKPAVKEQFYTQLYVDGELKNSWYTNPPLNGNFYAFVEDFAIGPLSPGTHTIQIRVDATKAVAESNEKDNVFTKTITVHQPILKPNLTPYQPNGWSSKIVVSTTTGSNTDANSFLAGETLYVDWAGVNNGNAATGKAFTSQLFVDGNLARTYHTPAPLNPGDYAYVEDIAIGPLSAGRHTIQIRLDTGGVIGELNEDDNAFTRTITVASRSTIAFAVNYTDSAGEGFYDPQRGAQRRAAFEYALGVWSSALAKAYEGETITVSASMDPMGGSQFGAILGSAGPNLLRWNFGGAAQANTVYGDALANHLAGRDLSPGSPEIVARFNSDVDNQTVLGSTDWYYGLDANPRGDIDFVSVVLHEVGHGLNFIDNINSGTGGWSAAGYPGIFDRFLETGGGTRLTSLDNAGRKAAITSNNLYWGGSQGRAGNGGTRPKMYAPNPYEPGSSVAHTDETVHRNDLMSPTYSGPDHTPGPIDLGILADMGWNPRAGAASAAVFGAAVADMGEEGWEPFGALIEHRYEALPPAAALRGAAAAASFDRADAGNAAWSASLASLTSGGPRWSHRANGLPFGILVDLDAGATASGAPLSSTAAMAAPEVRPAGLEAIRQQWGPGGDVAARTLRIGTSARTGLVGLSERGLDLDGSAAQGRAFHERFRESPVSDARLRDLALAVRPLEPVAEWM